MGRVDKETRDRWRAGEPCLETTAGCWKVTWPAEKELKECRRAVIAKIHLAGTNLWPNAWRIPYIWLLGSLSCSISDAASLHIQDRPVVFLILWRQATGKSHFHPHSHTTAAFRNWKITYSCKIVTIVLFLTCFVLIAYVSSGALSTIPSVH